MTAETRKGIILFSITDRGALYSSYMSFVNNGGVFVPTGRAYELGDEVFVLLQMMDNPNMMPVKGHVVWVTSAGAQGNKTPGIGVQFSDPFTRIELFEKQSLIFEFRWSKSATSGRLTLSFQ